MKVNPRKALVAVGVALVAALVASLAVAASGSSIKDNPPPPLFSDGKVAPLGGRLDAQRTSADASASRYLKAHPGRDDAAFARFAVGALPPPPGPRVQRKELALLHRATDRRSAGEDRATRWLGTYGKDDVWKLYAKQYAELSPAASGKRAKRLLKSTFDLADRIETAAKGRFNRPAPYTTDPSIRAIRTESIGKRKPSYPSKHTLFSYAALAELSRTDPGRAAEFRRMAHQVAYSRIAAGVHYPSDLATGAYLGTLLGDYELAAAGRR